MYDYSEYIDPIGNYFLGFLDVDGAAPRSLGSGTLVHYGNIYGILTCAHVLEAVLTRKSVGVLLFPAVAKKTQSMRLNPVPENQISIGTPSWGPNGPDIAFLRLNEFDKALLEATSSFVNLEKHFKYVLEGDPEQEHIIEIMSGVIAEQTGNPLIKGNISNTMFQGALNVGKVINIIEILEFDILQFDPRPSADFNAPNSYEGSSGGGLWRLYLNKKIDGTYDLSQRLLVGVAFYQTGGAPNLILCHGQKALYGKLLDRIREKWPTG